MWILIFLLALASCHASPASLEVVNDDELVNLFRSEKYVVVLFSKFFEQVRPSLQSQLSLPVLPTFILSYKSN